MTATKRPARYTGGGYAVAAAVLFGASTPFAKLLVGTVEPLLLAGLLYLGSGVGLAAWRWVVARQVPGRPHEARLTPADVPCLAGAIVAGGVIGPVLLMLGLASTPASTASLLLNMEGVLTAALAWWVFRENFDRRIALGMVAITAGGVLLSWTAQPVPGVPWGALAIAGACLAWALDNNLTRKVSTGDPLTIASLKGLVAGGVNLTLALAAGAAWPGVAAVFASAVVGLFGYGVSLTCYVLALRHLGTARTGAYFSLAPFAGAALSLVMFREPVTVSMLAATVLMAVGVWLHLTERHEHEHEHEPMRHDHLHKHDEHHQHEHAPDDPVGEPHSHLHHHQALRHAHPHYPDIHHRHRH